MAAIAGAPVDRTPYSLWYHFRLDPPTGAGMVAAELDFFDRYRPDLFKVMHDADFEMPSDLPVVREPEDWQRLRPLDGRSGTFGAQLETVKEIKHRVGAATPVIETVFSIHSTAQKACGKRTAELMGQDPDALRAGLETICQSICNYVAALMDAGLDGIYLAMSGAASDTMPAEEYREFFLPHDQRILDVASRGTVNVLHQHGGGIYPELGLGLKGCQVYCWSDRQAGNPSVAEMRLRTQMCLMAGVNEVTFGSVAPSDIEREIRETIAATNGRGVIVAPGCAVPTPPETPNVNLSAFRETLAS
jgi:uroporphyrinogen decarboxylase